MTEFDHAIEDPVELIADARDPIPGRLLRAIADIAIGVRGELGDLREVVGLAIELDLGRGAKARVLGDELVDLDLLLLDGDIEALERDLPERERVRSVGVLDVTTVRAPYDRLLYLGVEVSELGLDLITELALLLERLVARVLIELEVSQGGPALELTPKLVPLRDHADLLGRLLGSVEACAQIGVTFAKGIEIRALELERVKLGRSSLHEATLLRGQVV